jgi:Flp pilus assembly protein TadG
MTRFPRPFRLTRSRRGRRGQSLAEFALTFPMTLLLVLFGLDFGRVFLGWVSLTNATREAANFAAMNPDAWGSTPNMTVQAEYARLVNAETANANCTMPTTIPSPTFPSGKSIGSPALVTVTCSFRLITPIISNIVGSAVAVTASSAFPVRTGDIEGIPVATAVPTASPTAAPTASPTGAPTSAPTAAPSATAAPTATPAAQCRVPNLKNNQTSAAPAIWTGAGFTATHLVFSPLVGPNNNYKINDQSLTVGTLVLCSATMTVYDKVQH